MNSNHNMLMAARQDEINSGSTCASIPRRGPGRPEGFAAETARLTGQSKATINRDIRRAKLTTQEARDLIRHTELDTGAMLDRLVKIRPDEQVSYVHECFAKLGGKKDHQNRKHYAAVVKAVQSLAAIYRAGDFQHEGFTEEELADLLLDIPTAMKLLEQMNDRL